MSVMEEFPRTTRGDRTTGFRFLCERCGKGVEIDIVPKPGQSLAMPKNVLDQLERIANRMDRMEVERIRLSRAERDGGAGGLPSVRLTERTTA